MNVHIDIECTPEEFKELFIPSEKQVELAANFQQAMAKGMQEAMVKGMQQAMADGMQQAFMQQFNPFASGRGGRE
jgi:flagellar biosynthesis/type III secretory pathway protein FliH